MLSLLMTLLVSIKKAVFTQQQLDQMLATFSFLFEADGRISCSFRSRHFNLGFCPGFHPRISRRCKKRCMPNTVFKGKLGCIYRFTLFKIYKAYVKKNYIDYKIALLFKTLILVVIIFF